MTIYDSVIEIIMQDVFDKSQKANDELTQRLREIRKEYPVGPFEVTQERALLDLLWRRIDPDYSSVGENGYVGSFQNCVFSLLYAVFGADVIAFLFDRPWAPVCTVG